MAVCKSTTSHIYSWIQGIQNKNWMWLNGSFLKSCMFSPTQDFSQENGKTYLLTLNTVSLNLYGKFMLN